MKYIQLLRIVAPAALPRRSTVDIMNSAEAEAFHESLRGIFSGILQWQLIENHVPVPMNRRHWWQLFHKD